MFHFGEGRDFHEKEKMRVDRDNGSSTWLVLNRERTNFDSMKKGLKGRLKIDDRWRSMEKTHVVFKCGW